LSNKSFEINRVGCTRIVFLTRKYAFKIPNVTEYRLLLHGLLANLQECTFSAAQWPELCPVLFSLPLGLLVVMPRVRILTDEEFLAIDIERWIDRGEYVVPVEAKSNSFGWLNGNLVAVDYG
jgi:hypothetical protein